MELLCSAQRAQMQTAARVVKKKGFNGDKGETEMLTTRNKKLKKTSVLNNGRVDGRQDGEPHTERS